MSTDTLITSCPRCGRPFRDLIVEPNKMVWTTQVHALRKGRFTFVAQKQDGFRVEFKPFKSHREAVLSGCEMLGKLNKVETEK